MANSQSAKKRIKQNERNHTRNRTRKSEVKTLIKRFLKAVHDKDLPAATDGFSKVTKRLDQISAKGTIHRNTCARKKSRLARRLNALQTPTESTNA